MNKKQQQTTKGPTLIGRGVLNWFKAERISDRYGTVTLSTDDGKPAEMWIPKGKGTLEAVVIDARKSDHIGDIFRGLRPRMPKVGQKFVLGAGRAFTETMDGITSVGVEPPVERESDWLDPRALYDCHNSVVELQWTPARKRQ